jgi:hypothetical protein
MALRAGDLADALRGQAREEGDVAHRDLGGDAAIDEDLGVVGQLLLGDVALLAQGSDVRGACLGARRQRDGLAWASWGHGRSPSSQ